MTDLTEKWEKGELPAGWYWVEGSRAEGIYAYTAEYLNNMYRPKNGEKIIEQVPSYEIVNSLTQENQQLKELLYKGREKLDRLDYGCEVWAGELTGFIEEIDQVIGKKK